MLSLGNMIFMVKFKYKFSFITNNPHSLKTHPIFHDNQFIEFKLRQNMNFIKYFDGIPFHYSIFRTHDIHYSDMFFNMKFIFDRLRVLQI